MVVGVLSLAPCYVGKSRYVELIRLHILVNCMELRWRQPCSDPVAPCKYKQVSCNCKTVRVKEVLHLFRCYTHTLDKKWIIEVIRWELNPLTCNLIRNKDLK